MNANNKTFIFIIITNFEEEKTFIVQKLMN